MDLNRDLPLVVLFLVLFASSIVLAAAEASILRVSRVATEVRAEGGVRRAKRLLGELDDLSRVLNTILLAVLLVQLAAASVTGVLAARWFGGVGVTLATFLLTIVLFVYSEAIPKTFAVRNPLRTAEALSGLVAALSVALRPVVAVLVAFADLQSPGRGIAVSAAVGEEELRRLVAESATAGEIEASDQEFIERSFQFGDLRVQQICVPRLDVVAIEAHLSASAALEVAIGSGHRRLPVYDGTLDRVLGVVRLRDLARAVSSEQDPQVAALAAEVLVVPETLPVVPLLRRMQEVGQFLALVVDEHGATTGIVTIEDVVGELVGEIEDQPAQRPTPVSIGPGRWSVPARVTVDELEGLLGTSLPRGSWQTVGGLVIHTAGRIPDVGDEVVVDGITFCVTRRSRQRVLELEVVGPPAPT